VQGKKLFATGVTVAIILGACSSNATPAPAATATPAPAATAAKAWKLTLIQGIKGDPFYVTMACGAQAEATKEGAELTITGGDQWDPSVQTPIVDSVTASKPDGVMIAPNDPTAMLAPLKNMSDAGIKVTFVDTGLTDQSFDSSFITSNNIQGGQLAATTLATLIGDKGTVLGIDTNPGNSTGDARVKGFVDEMKNHPNITLLPVVYAGNDATGATSVTTSTMAAHSDLAGIFAMNDTMAEGASAALKQAGTTAVKMVSFDAGPNQIQDLKTGVLQALIAQDPFTIGVDGVQQTILALNGEPTTKNIQTALVTITAANLNDPAVQEYIYKSSC
jgi:ribose transport system substrate-binding protein